MIGEDVNVAQEDPGSDLAIADAHPARGDMDGRSIDMVRKNDMLR
jgi:hypothetical protein